MGDIIRSRSTRKKIIQETGNMSAKFTVVSKQYTKSSSSIVQDSHDKAKNLVEVSEAESTMLGPARSEHEQNVYNTELLKSSPQMANGQVKQMEEDIDSTHDQSWFRVHSDVFKDKFYWNHYEKTDLTYSKLSPYYKVEISPGVPMMPNLSRRPLRSHSITATFTPQHNMYQSSSHSRVRSSSSSGNSSISSSINKNIRNTYVEQRASGYGFDGYSDDEGDFIRRRRTVDIHEQQHVSVMTTVYNFIATMLTSIYTSISHATSTLLNRRSVVYGDVNTGYSTPQAHHQRHTSSVKWGQWLYRLLCLQLLADSWLVHHLISWTHMTSDSGRRSNRPCLMFGLLFLLPLALLAGWWAVGAYPILSSKPAEYLQMLAQLGNRHSSKEEIHLPVISNSNNEKEYLDMKSYIASLVEQVEALREQVKQQHVKMESQQEQLHLVEKVVERLDEPLSSKASKIELAMEHLQMSLQSITGKVHRLSRCCDRQPLIPAAVIQGHVLHFLRNILSNGGTHDHADIHAWLKSMFVAKDELETRLANVSAAIQNNVSEELVHSAKIIMESVAERIIQSKLDQQQSAFQATIANSIDEAGGDGLTYAQVKQIVQEALLIYDADKTGLVDYALESSGGSILSTRCTENFNTQSATLYMFNVRWLPWFSVGTSPRVAIQPHMSPGECWAFAGAQGFLVIQLSREVYVTGFTLEHIPKSLSPNGHIDSAPEKFSVWGLEHENDEDPSLLGNYVYMQNSSSLQHFKVQQEEARPFRIVELKVISNHGHPNYTCIYRFRVHGTPV